MVGGHRRCAAVVRRDHIAAEKVPRRIVHVEDTLRSMLANVL